MGNPVDFVGDASDIHLGPASVTYNSKNLGYTLNDSVSIQIAQESTEILPDQSSLPVKDIITGMTLNVTMTLGEVTTANLDLLPGFSGGTLSDPMGTDLLTGAKELILYPVSDGDTNVYTFPKASPMMTGPIQFARTTPQGLELNFKCYFDSAGGDALVVSQKSV